MHTCAQLHLSYIIHLPLDDSNKTPDRLGAAGVLRFNDNTIQAIIPTNTDLLTTVYNNNSNNHFNHRLKDKLNNKL